MHVYHYQVINKKLSYKPCTFREIYKKLLFGAKKLVRFSTIRILIHVIFAKFEMNLGIVHNNSISSLDVS